MTALRSRYVSVHLESLGDLPAVVESEDEGTVVVSLAVRRPACFERALGRPVGLQWLSARGIQRITGLAKWDAARPDELRIARESSKVIQRRDAVRVDGSQQRLARFIFERQRAALRTASER